jgi:hypothetical protein
MMIRQPYVQSVALIPLLAQSPVFLCPLSFYLPCASTGSSYVVAQSGTPADVLATALRHQGQG